MQTQRQQQAQRNLTGLQRHVRRLAIRQHEQELLAAFLAESDDELIERLRFLRRQRRLIRRALKARRMQGGV